MNEESVAEDVIRRLRPITAALEADGYILRVASFEHGRIALAISASTEACADCLVGKDMMAKMVAAVLEDGPYAVPADAVTLTYPNEAHG